MRGGWEIKTVKDVCKFLEDGDWIESKDQALEGIRLIQTGNIGEGYFKNRLEKSRYISENTFKRLRCTEIFEGDCLVSRLPDPIGRACLLPSTDSKMITGVDCAIIRFDDKLIIPNWFIYFTQSVQYKKQIDIQSGGATRQRISRKNLALVNLPLPQIEEQNQIIYFIEQAFTSIDKAKAIAEQNLKNAKELFESYLQSIFENPQSNWEVCNLEKHIKLIDYRGRTPVKTDSGVRLITAKNVKLGYLKLEPQEFIAENNYESWMARGVPNFGDVIFTTEAPLANVAQVDTYDKIAFAQRIIVMQPDLAKLNQTFLKYMLISHPIRNKILEKGTGATVLGIKSSLLKKIEIYFPESLQTQEIIVQKLDALSIEIQKLKSIYEQKIKDLDELKKSILQKAFNGELKLEELAIA